MLLVGVTPGGFEKMFEERQGVNAETNRALMKKHNMEVVGPPCREMRSSASARRAHRVAGERRRSGHCVNAWHSWFY